ncbi:hypothetical protein CYLTODRAFT_455311 [Cylindrobasidium torrendii FP15055 ss-10]|uniref:DUF6535 domain-containing protein n=1 Tax=Cylindrobasidium torrendii FP15055 ss-10 TaxID=1314674 RepID=A0A0D7BAF3_9AGAR|nr:hypothetical protein CYLTODRAFT_455311 [Cylindrobasidium torrendii FP15055 ss-10]
MPKVAFQEKTMNEKRHESSDPKGFPSSHYAPKYPRDQRYKQLSNNTHVWRLCNNEAAILDTGIADEAAHSLDMLLASAGLLAFIISTFVVQTSKSLQPDNAAVTDALLDELIAIQRAMLAGTPLSDVPVTNVAPPPNQADVWVNGLWFTSLVLCLVVALLAMMSKQWLHQYTTFIAGPARERATICQFPYDGTETRAVRTAVELLPAVFHLALSLFVAGLVVFLAPPEYDTVILVGTVIGLACIAIYASNNLTAVCPQLSHASTVNAVGRAPLGSWGSGPTRKQERLPMVAPHYIKSQGYRLTSARPSYFRGHLFEDLGRNCLSYGTPSMYHSLTPLFAQIPHFECRGIGPLPLVDKDAAEYLQNFEEDTSKAIHGHGGIRKFVHQMFCGCDEAGDETRGWDDGS